MTKKAEPQVELLTIDEIKEVYYRVNAVAQVLEDANFGSTAWELQSAIGRLGDIISDLEWADEDF